VDVTSEALSQLAILPVVYGIKELAAGSGRWPAAFATAAGAAMALLFVRRRRAKQKIKAAGASFAMTSAAEFAARLRVVLHVLYLIFNEGYLATSGPDLQRAELTSEAIRLAREVRRLLPDHGEVAGLLALMLTDARRAARTRHDGTLVTIAEQDRDRWDRAAMDAGVNLITTSLSRTPLGPYQLQAAIAAVHDEAPTAKDTDWPQILGLYELLEVFSPGPMTTLNRAIATAMVIGPRAGLDIIGALEGDPRIARHHRIYAVRAHLLEMAGEYGAARADFERGAQHALSVPEHRYLAARAARLRSGNA
jgi:predicted RNA polymerase sigma factor